MDRNTASMKIKMLTIFYSEYLKGGAHLADLGVIVRIILKCRVRTRFNSLKIETSGGLL
jgi:hypothetical protein